MRYLAEITVKLKAGMLDPEGATIRRALGHLGFHTEDVRSAREYSIELEAPSAGEAEQQIDEMCRKLIANPVIHDYSIDLKELG